MCKVWVGLVLKIEFEGEDDYESHVVPDEFCNMVSLLKQM